MSLAGVSEKNRVLSFDGSDVAITTAVSHVGSVLNSKVVSRESLSYH